MKIIDNEYFSSREVNKNSKFTITFQDENECDVVMKKINLLATDDSIKVWDAFQGKKAQKLLANAIDGLIIFLSYKKKNNIISGEFFSLDEKQDAQLFSDYIYEAQNNAKVDIDCLEVAAA